MLSLDIVRLGLCFSTLELELGYLWRGAPVLWPGMAHKARDRIRGNFCGCVLSNGNLFSEQTAEVLERDRERKKTTLASQAEKTKPDFSRPQISKLLYSNKLCKLKIKSDTRSEKHSSAHPRRLSFSKIYSLALPRVSQCLAITCGYS